MFHVTFGATRNGFEEEELIISGGEFTSGGLFSGVHGKARHYFTFISFIVLLFPLQQFIHSYNICWVKYGVRDSQK